MKNTLAASVLDSFRQAMGYEMPRVGRLGFALYWRFVPRQIHSTLMPGLRINMDLNDRVQREIYWHGGRSEPHLRSLLLDLCAKNSSIYFDIGANFGFFSYYLLSHVATLTVHAFEPGTKYSVQMQETKEQNSLSRFHIHRRGLGNEDGVLEFFEDPENTGNCSFLPQHPNRSGQSEVLTHRVPVVRFDHWADEQGLADDRSGTWMAKIDVEGFELKVLQGMGRYLEERRFKAVVLEVFSRTLATGGTSPAEIFDYLEQSGYQPIDEVTRRPTECRDDDENRNVCFLRKGEKI